MEALEKAKKALGVKTRPHEDDELGQVSGEKKKRKRIKYVKK